MKVTVMGCSGSYAGPDSVGQLLPGRGATTPTTRAAPGGCCSTSAPARSAPCTGTSTRSPSTRCSSATCTPTTSSTSAATTCMRKYHPTGAAAAASRSGGRAAPGRACARAYGLPLDPGMNEEFEFRRIKRDRSRSARSRSPRAGWTTPSRPTPSASSAAAEPRLQRRHRGVRGADRAGQGRRPAAVRGGVPRRRRQPAAHPHDRLGGRGDGPGGRRRLLVLTHIPPWHDKQDAIHEAAGIFDGPVAAGRRGLDLPGLRDRRGGPATAPASVVEMLLSALGRPPALVGRRLGAPAGTTTACRRRSGWRARRPCERRGDRASRRAPPRRRG